ncbi:NAD(P)-dependent oxidoreductase [Spirulina subsalsa FACHB-351]|uniref:NAD(P)-dependent oxidoreductase n=1 Tax=Spirulina subsalsa FACHB-351 TaxID=234711 RepID=A0ABT3L3R7_9CYAN|nr:NAD(P)-dependent oxidoreductase [Spirulina subsalsa]MCW6036154.1 NAD(P)-dependent oxidoreductase [Spirulina subsalsa FACHB-351]
MSQTVAFLGLGVMGGYMAANLARQGYTVQGWNRTPQKTGVNIAASAGVQIVPTLEAAVTGAKVVFSCVGDVPDVEAVLLGESGAARYASPQTLLVDFSTIGSQAAKTIAQALADQNLSFLDAPISGGDVGAKNGTLTIMVGGREADFQAALPYFEAMGKTIRLCGPVGSGQAVKMCNQILCALNLVGICEAMILAEKQGLDPQIIVEVCGTGAAGSWALSNLGLKVATGDFTPGFMIKHILKDLRLVREIAATARQELPGVALAEDLFKRVEALDELAREQGTQAMMRAYRN